VLLKKSEQKPFLSVVIPFYNEEKNLEQGKLDEVHHYLEKQDYLWEVILVDDQSTDKSRSLVETFIWDKDNYTLVAIPHGGKPRAIRAGVHISRGDIVLFTDMDQSTPIHEVESLLPWFDKGFDMVIGSRGVHREGLSMIRKMGSRVFRTLRRFVLLRHIIDTQCGFKACTRETAMELFPRLQYFNQTKRPSGWKVSAYDVELLDLVQKTGTPIKEVAVQWWNRDKRKKKKLFRYMHESIEMANEVLRVKFNALRGLYP
jgi:dolichyl-phosphate beta-glucosyltransferase